MYSVGFILWRGKMNDINRNERGAINIKDIPGILSGVFSVVFLIRENFHLATVLFGAAALGLALPRLWSSYRSAFTPKRLRNRALASLVVLLVLLLGLFVAQPTRGYIVSGFIGTPTQTATPTAQPTVVLPVEVTQTPTPSPTATATKTTRPTRTPTITATDTQTPTPVPPTAETPTAAPPTLTPTLTSTITPTATLKPGSKIDLENANRIHLIKSLDAQAVSLAWSPDGRYLAASTAEGVSIYAVGPFIRRRVLARELNEPPVAFFSDGRLITGGAYAAIWNVETGEAVAKYRHLKNVIGVSISSDDSLLGLYNGQALIVADAASGDVLLSVPVGVIQAGPVFSPDGKRMATAGKEIQIYDATTGDLLTTLPGHNGWIKQIIFSPDGTKIASVSVDETAKIWDLATETLSANLEGHTGGVDGIAFSPDSSIAVTVSWDTSVRLWNVSTGQEIHRLVGHVDWVRRVVFSPNGRLIVSSDYSGNIMVWGLEP